MKYAKLLLAAAFCAAGTFIAAQAPAKPQPKKAAPAVKAEPKKAEPKKAEPKKAEPKKAEPKKAEPKKAEPKKAEPKKAEPKKAEPKKAEPKKAEPKKAEPKKAEPKKAEPKKAEPKKAEPKKAEPKKAEPEKVEIPAPKNVFTPPAPKKPAEKKAPVYKISRLIPSILIVSNYNKPVFLAKYCCSELNIPYILIIDKTDTPDANARLALFLPKAKEPIMLTAKDLSRLLAYIRAREVVLLGDAEYMPVYYRKAVPSTSRLIAINDADWSENTLRLASILRADSVKKAYRDYKAECERKRQELENAKKNLRRSEEALRDIEGH